MIGNETTAPASSHWRRIIENTNLGCRKLLMKWGTSAVCLTVLARTANPVSAGASQFGVLLAADSLSHEVMILDLDHPGDIRPFTSGAVMDFDDDIAIGPDRHLYVMDGHYQSTNRVVRFDGRTGQFIDVFADCGPDAWDGGCAFGPDGHLYVLCSYHTVRKFDGKTGTFITDVLTLPGLTFYCIAAGPDGMLYLPGDGRGCSWGEEDCGSNLLARCALDGSRIELLPIPGFGNGPRKPVWGRDGSFYSANLNEGVVRRFQGDTGVLVNEFADPPDNGHVALAFGGDGHLYVSGVWSRSVYRVDGTNGSYLGVLANNLCVHALLAVPPPEITKQPAALTVCQGGTAPFAVEVKSVLLPRYQWKLNGAPIAGATNASLRVSAVSTNQAGDYVIEVSNIGGSALSSTARLTVTPPVAVLLSRVGKFEYSLRITDEGPAIYALEVSTNLTDWTWTDTITKNWEVPVPAWQSLGGPWCFYRARLLAE